MTNKNNLNLIDTVINAIMFCVVIFLVGSCTVEVSNPSQPFHRNQEMVSEIFYYLFLIICIFVVRVIISYWFEKLLLSKSEINERNKKFISERDEDIKKMLDDNFL